MSKKILAVLIFLAVPIVGFAITTNPSTSLPQIGGDVHVVHKNGNGYWLNATTSSDIGRGTALLTAISACQAGDSYYLGNSLFNVQGGRVNLQCGTGLGLNLYGEGSTTITSSINGSPIIVLGNRTTVKNIIGKGSASHSQPFGFEVGLGDNVAASSTLENIYCDNVYQCVYVSTVATPATVTVRNLTCFATFDCIVNDDSAATINVYNSSLYVNDNGGEVTVAGVYNDGGTTNLYKTDCSSNATPAHTASCAYAVAGTINWRGGDLTVSGGAQSVLRAVITGAITVSPDTIYNRALEVGTITYEPTNVATTSIMNDKTLQFLTLTGNDISLKAFTTDDLLIRAGGGSAIYMDTDELSWVANPSLGVTGVSILDVPRAAFVSGDWIPQSGGFYDLGTTTSRWRSLNFGAATSTGTNGINLTAGCFAVNNVCITGSATGQVVLVHSDGTQTLYNPSANTDLARGTALMTASNAAVNLDTIVICDATYDVGSLQSNFIDLSKSSGAGSVDIKGCSEQNTIVKGYPAQSDNALIAIGASSTVSNLTAWNYGTTSIRVPLGRVLNTFDLSGFVIRNVKTISISDGFYIVRNNLESASGIIDNFDCTSNWDCFVINAFGGHTRLYDSRAVVTASTTVSNSNTAMIISGGQTIDLYGYDYDVTATTTTRGILCSQAGTPASTINFYNGKAHTATSRLGSGATVFDLFQSGANCILNVSSNVQYNTASTSGAITYTDSNPIIKSIQSGTINFGLGTTSPWTTLSVNGSSDLGNSALAGYFTATTTTSSVFPNASTTNLTASSYSNTGTGSQRIENYASCSIAANTGRPCTLFKDTGGTGKGYIDVFTYANETIPGTEWGFEDHGGFTTNQYFRNGNFSGSANPTLRDMAEFSGEQYNILFGTSTCSSSCTSVFNPFFGVLAPSTSNLNRASAYHTNIFEFASSTAGGASYNDLLVGTASGSVGIGTSSPWRTLSVNGSSDLGTNALFGSFTATTTTATSTVAGSLAIGTTTSNSALEINGSSHIEEQSISTSTTMTIDFSAPTVSNIQTMKVGTANIAITFTNAGRVPGKSIILDVIAPASGLIGSTTFSGGSGSGNVIWDGSINPGNSVLNGSTDRFIFTSTNGTTTPYIQADLTGTF